MLFSFLSVPTDTIQPIDSNAILSPFFALFALIKAYRWKIFIALAASIGGAIGSLLVRADKKPK